MIKEAYCSYKVARLLKEKGFDELCNKKYNGNKNIVSAGKMIELWQNSEFDNDEECSAPTHQMAVAYLMEVHNLYICPKYRCFCGSRQNDRPYFKWEARILKLPSSNIIYPHPLGMCEHYETYEDAVEAALKYALENIITKEDKK